MSNVVVVNDRLFVVSRTFVRWLCFVVWCAMHLLWCCVSHVVGVVCGLWLCIIESWPVRHRPTSSEEDSDEVQ